jgi:circadian clock protein KaiC
VSGATGTGKTLIASEFLNAAAKDGERALYFSFEESRNQMIRNARSWGIDFVDHERAGVLRLEFRRPERMLLEDLLLEIRTIVEEFAPTRVVVDGLTSLERSALREAFREFAVAVVSYMKEKDIAVVFTDTVSMSENSESSTEAHISTMTDVILLLRYVESGGAAHRGLLAMKMRGTDHDSAVHEYRITSSGIEMLGPMHDVSGFIPGAATAPSR